ncbi:MAG: hypothetical protein RBJ76_19135 [Stenomitos frigidus ULC029]
MTSQKDQIQALITEIDGVLQKTTPRLPWVVSGDLTQQRQVLERVRNYLVAFQRRQIAGEGFGQAEARPDLLAHDISYQSVPSPYPRSQAASQSEQQLYGQNEANAQQMLQAIVQEMGSLRSNLMQPLQTDLEVLRQQRETLIQEIRQLEAQRQGYAGSLPGQQQLITEFLQALMIRLQETLPQQVAQTLSSADQQALPYASANANNLALAGSAPSILSTSDASSQGLGNIQVSQGSSDELLIRLDSTLSIVFESLQRNVQAYQESLSQGLDKMHSMGQQGEMMFTALISHLAQQLGRETSSYLQPSATTTSETGRSTSPSFGNQTNLSSVTQPLTPTVNPALFDQTGAEAVSQSFTLPFPGTEISDSAADASARPSTNVPVSSVDSAINAWLRSASSADAPSDVDSDIELEIAALNLEGFDLSQLAAQDVNALLELDSTLLGTNLPPQPLLSPTPPAASEAQTPDTVTIEDTADIDAALKLLEQLSSELQEQPSSVADADAQIDRMLTGPTTPLENTSTVGILDDARDELDEFYESLFGTDAIASSTEASANPVADATEVEFQLAAAPVIESEPAIVPQNTQPSETQPSTFPPISTLPAETQAPTDTPTEPTPLSASFASTVDDPTLGWLPAAPLDALAATEPEIPVALLEDELLDGWDLADAESGWSELATTSAGDDPLAAADLLSGWDLTSDDRAPLVADEPLPPSTDTLAAFFGDSQPLATEASPGVDPLLAATPVNDQNRESKASIGPDSESEDEIGSLDDLFGDSAFGSALPAEDQPLEQSIDDVFTASTPPAQPLINAPVSPTGWSFPDEAKPTQPPSADLVEGYLSDDRYMPASPDEDLLLLDEPVEALDSELWLDENTLSRLSEDLFQLEEVIDASSTLPFGNDADANSSALPSDVVTPSESGARSTETSPLGDWSDAFLDDFGVDEAIRSDVALGDVAPDTVAATPPPDFLATFPLESDVLSIAVEPPSNFVLEGMDDLFANTPVEPPVTPISPPVPPIAIESPASFTLEGMDDLFADPLVGEPLLGDRGLPAAPAPATEPAFTLEAFTLEGEDTLFADAPTVSTGSLPTVEPEAAETSFTLEGEDALFADASLSAAIPSATDQPLPFTLEGVEELFADMPPVLARPPARAVPPVALPVDDLLVQPEASTAAASTQADSVAAFTFEQMGDLFMELPDAEALPIAATPNLPAESTALTEPFTLEQVGDLFVERSAAESTSSEGTSETPAASLESATAPFTFEQVGDLFVEAPLESTVESTDAPLTFEQVGDLFAETPSAPLESTVESATAPFTFEQVGDLFVEAPLESTVESTDAPFTLEQMGDLFTETSAAASPVADLPDAILSTPQPSVTPEPSALEQAFASLMGSFDDPIEGSPSRSDTPTSTTETAEKKKEMS